MNFKIKLIIFIIFLCFIVLPNKVNAQNEYFTDTDVEYVFSKDGAADVSYKIVIENKFATLAPKSYTITLNKIDVGNVKAIKDNKYIPIKKLSDSDTTTLSVDLSNSDVGIGSKTVFTITFQTKSFTTHTGEVWEISLPRLSNKDDYRNYNVTFSIPDSFGEKAYVSPLPLNEFKSGDRQIFTFNKDSVAAGAVIAAFGDFQVFSFDLNYHLQNPLLQTAQTEIAIPPDTNYQKVFITSFNPKPENIYVDEDGNWIAKFSLNPRQKIDVRVMGNVQIFAKTINIINYSDEYLKKNLQPADYWEVDNSKITGIANTLKGPLSIYNYVVNSLSYDISRVTPNVSRMGALKALSYPNNAICMEYTDLFIALSRASGIPAREINGYAYSENTDVQPLSLVADVLHSWPEYWDDNSKDWKMVDPTWGDTTGGLDFFNKNDLRHFVFVIHGTSSTKPYPPGSYKLGTNPQKDVFINFGNLPEARKDNIEISASTKNSFFLLNKRLLITLKNTGTAASYKVDPYILFGESKITLKEVDVIPPYGNITLEAKVPYNFLGFKNTDTIKVFAGGKSLEIPSNIDVYIQASLIIISFLLIVFLIFIIIRMKR